MTSNSESTDQRPGEIHQAINEHLARLSRCYTQYVHHSCMGNHTFLGALPAKMLLRADTFRWIWTGYGDNSAPPIPGQLLLPHEGFFRPEPPIKWERYVVYYDGYLILYNPRKHEPAFLHELCNPGLQESLKEFVDNEVNRLHNLKRLLDE